MYVAVLVHCFMFKFHQFFFLSNCIDIRTCLYDPAHAHHIFLVFLLFCFASHPPASVFFSFYFGLLVFLPLSLSLNITSASVEMTHQLWLRSKDRLTKGVVTWIVEMKKRQAIQKFNKIHNTCGIVGDKKIK